VLENVEMRKQERYSSRLGLEHACDLGSLCKILAYITCEILLATTREYTIVSLYKTSVERLACDVCSQRPCSVSANFFFGRTA
jgi:hypothetical protein